MFCASCKPTPAFVCHGNRVFSLKTVIPCVCVWVVFTRLSMDIHIFFDFIHIYFPDPTIHWIKQLQQYTVNTHTPNLRKDYS